MHNAVTVESRMMQQYRLMLQNNWKRCEAMERASGVGNQWEIMCSWTPPLMMVRLVMLMMVMMMRMMMLVITRKEQVVIKGK